MTSKILSLLVLLSSLAFGQGVLMPMPTQQFFDNNGNPLNGGLVYTYSSGTSTPLATYTDFSGIVQNQNPVVLDSAGYPSNGSARVGIWLQAGQTYRIKLCSALPSPCATQYWVMDGITGILTGLASTVSANTTVTYSASPTFTSLAQTQLFKMTLTGNVTSSTLVMTGLSVPAYITFEWTQDSGGSHTVVYPTNVARGETVSPLPNSITKQTFIWNGTNATPIGFADINTRTLALPSASDTIVGRISTDTLSNKTLTSPGTGNLVSTIPACPQTGQQPFITGNSSQVLFACTLPANQLSAGQGFIVDFGIQHTVGGATPQVTLQVNAQVVGSLVLAASVGYCSGTTRIFANGNQTTMGGFNLHGGGQCTSWVGTLANTTGVDFSTPQVVQLVVVNTGADHIIPVYANISF